MDAIIQFFMEKWPVLTMLLVAIVGFVWLAVWITRHIEKAKYYLDGKFKEVDGKFSVLDGKFEKLDGRFAVLDGKFEKLDGKFAVLDGKFAVLDGKFEKLDGKFAVLDGKFEKLDGKFNELDGKFNELDGKFNELDGKFEKLDEKFEEQEKVLKSLPCERHTLKLEAQKERADGLDKRIVRAETLRQALSDSVTAIQVFLQTKYPASAPVFSQKFSPRKLNEKGREMFEIFGGKSFLDANEGMLLGRIAEKKPKTALDVEQYALNVLYETLDDDIFNEIKLKVYNSEDIQVEIDGKRGTYSITMSDICFIFSLDLRDRYLDKHPEVPQKVA